MDWLGQDLKFMSLSAGFLQKVGGRSLPGEEKNLASRHQLTYLNCSFNAVHVGHDYVADHQVRTSRAGTIHCGYSSIDSRRLEAVLVQDDRQRISDNSFIIYNQHASFRRLSV